MQNTVKTLNRDSIFKTAYKQYQIFFKFLNKNNWLARITSLLVFTLLSTLVWYLLLGYLQFNIWKQPDPGKHIDHFILNILKIDGIKFNYFQLKGILMMWVDSLSIVLPTIFMVSIVTLYASKISKKSKYSFLSLSLSFIINIFIALVPSLIAFYITEAYFSNNTLYKEQTTWFLEKFIDISSDYTYFESFSIYALSTLTPWFIWICLLLLEISKRSSRSAIYVLTFMFQVLRFQYSISNSLNIEAEKLEEVHGINHLKHKIKGYSILTRAAIARFGGYDFFISYSRKPEKLIKVGGYNYAHKLKEILESDGFKCFIDDSSMHHGESWKKSVFKALTRSSVLLVVANAKALKQSSVINEIRTFSHMPRPIMPISFNNSVKNLDTNLEVWSLLEQRLRCEEPRGIVALKDGIPSPDIIETCNNAFIGVKIQRVRQLILFLLVLVLTGLSLFAWRNATKEVKARKALNIQLIGSSSINEIEKNPYLALILARKSGDLLENTQPPSSTINAINKILNQWPALHSAQRIVTNTLLTSSPWLEKDFIAVGSSYAWLFPELRKPREFQPIEYRNPIDFSEINPTSGTYLKNINQFILGDYKGNIYKLSRDASKLKLLENLADDRISPIVSTESLPNYILYATEADHPEICLLNIKTMQTQKINFNQFKYQIDQLAMTSNKIYALSRGNLFEASLLKIKDEIQIDENSWKKLETPIDSIDHFALKADSNIFAVTDGYKYFIIDSSKNEIIHNDEFKNTYISALTFALNSNQIAISLQSNKKNEVICIDFYNKKSLNSYPSLDNVAASYIKYIDNDSKLVSVSYEGLAVIWDLEIEQLQPTTLPGKLIAVEPKFKGGFDLLIDKKNDEPLYNSNDNIRVNIMPYESTGTFHDFSSSVENDFLFLSKGNSVYKKSPSDENEWEKLLTDNTGKQIKKLDTINNHIWLFRDDLMFNNYDLKNGSFNNEWLKSPRSSARFVNRSMSKNEIEQRSIIRQIIYSPQLNLKLLILSNGSLIKYQLGLLQKLNILPLHSSLTYGITNISSNEIIHTSNNNSFLAIANENSSEVTMFHIKEKRIIKKNKYFDKKPVGLALSNHSEMLAIIFEKQNPNTAEGIDLILQILDPNSFEPLTSEILIPGEYDEERHPLMAFDPIEEKLLISRYGRDYIILPFSFNHSYQQLRNKVSFELFPDEAKRYNLEYIELPKRSVK